jgi:hypothetical protein
VADGQLQKNQAPVKWKEKNIHAHKIINWTGALKRQVESGIMRVGFTINPE